MKILQAVTHALDTGSPLGMGGLVLAAASVATLTALHGPLGLLIGAGAFVVGFKVIR